MEFKRMTLEMPVLEVLNPEIEAMRKSLAERARRELGYGLLKEHLQKKEEERNVISLIQALADLEKEPFDRNEVTQYQAKEQKLKNREAFFDLPLCGKVDLLVDKILSLLLGSNDVSNKRRNFLYFLFFASGIVGVFAEIFALIHQNWLLALIVVPFFLFFCCFLIGLVCDSIIQEKQIKIKEWVWEPLTFTECYEKKIEVPEFVIDTALRVKERVPEAKLYMEVLESTERLLGDPFLVAEHGGQKFYIEVWDESKFEKRRKI